MALTFSVAYEFHGHSLLPWQSRNQCNGWRWV